MHGLKIFNILRIFLSSSYLLFLSKGSWVNELLCRERVLNGDSLKIRISFHLHLFLRDYNPLVSLSAGTSFAPLPWHWACGHHCLSVSNCLLRWIKPNIQIWYWNNLRLVFIHTHVSILLMAR